MNQWIKLAVVSLSGIVISFGVLWGIQQFEQNRYYNGYNQQQYQQGAQAGMNTQYGNGMNMQGTTNNQAGMNAQGGAGGGMTMQGSSNGMNMQAGGGSTQGNAQNMQTGGGMSAQGSSSMATPMMDDSMMGMDKMMGMGMGGM